MINLKNIKMGVAGCFLAATLLSPAIGCGGSSGDDSESKGTNISAANIPGLPEWEANMVSQGRALCNPAKIAELSTWEGNVWYYDGMRVFRQIADYTGDASWNDCVRYVRDVYRPYVLNAGKVPGAK